MRAALCLAVSVAACTAQARAEEPAGNSRAAAEALFQEGVRLSERGRLEEACEKLEASEALDVAVGTLLRLADCRERTGRLASAWARFREAGSLAETQGMTDRARIAAVRSAALEPKLARLVLEVPATPPEGFTVTLETTPVPRGSWGSPLPLDAGTVAIEAAAPGHLPYRRYVAIPSEEGARVRVVIPMLEPKRAATPTARTVVVRSEAPPPSNDGGYAARVVGASLAATGAAGLATGGVLALIAKSRRGAARDACSAHPELCDSRGALLRRDAGRLADYAVVSAAVGGGLLLTGLMVYLAAPSERAAKRVALAVAPDVRGGLSLSATGDF